MAPLSRSGDRTKGHSFFLWIKQLREDGASVILGTFKNGTLGLRLTQICALELRRATKIVATEISLPQIGTAQIHFLEIGTLKLASSKSA